MTPKQFVKAYNKHGSIKAVARQSGVSYHVARNAYLHAVEEGLVDKQPVGRKSRAQTKTPEPPVFEGKVKAMATPEFKLPAKGKVKRYLFTSAQNDTKLHDQFFENLLTLAKHYDAKLHVARFTYVKSGLGARGDKAEAVRKADNKEDFYSAKDLWWDARLIPYFLDKRRQIAPGLVWCGEMNILPTAVRPLSGLEVYTGRQSGIFPHVKLAMESIPSGKFEATKFNYTTGTVTLRNYIQRKAGLKAEFHHCYGALLVEVDSDGNWFVRQINADSEGVIHDLDLRVDENGVTTGLRVEAITWGDIHVQRMDRDVYELAWGDDSIVDALRPKYQFIHDLLNFGSRNHHDMKDPFKQFSRFVEKNDSVEREVAQAMDFIAEISDQSPDSQIIIVDSNHDRALERWLRESEWRTDPVNMLFYMSSVQAKLLAIRDNDKDFHMMRHWWTHYERLMTMPGEAPRNVRFLDEDESFVVCEDAHGGIECGMHGHLGPNGARGGDRAFARMGRRANKGHSHIAGIVDGVFSSGTSSELDLEYNRGPSSWSHSLTLTYENGKRAIITIWNLKWRA